MANFEMEYVTCPVCKGQKTAKIYSEVNVSENKKLRDKILKDSLFRFRCSNCGYEDQNNYPFLYTDLDDKLLVWHIPESERDKILDIIDEINKEGNLKEKESKNFIFRVVKNLNELKEKIILRNLNLDDRVMEVVKLLYLNSIMLSDNPLDLNRLFGIYFNVEQNNWQICFVMEDEENLYLDISRDTYMEVESLSKEARKIVLDNMGYGSDVFSLIDKSFGEQVIIKLLEKNKI